MKKIILLVFLIGGVYTNAQEFKTEGKTVIGIFEAEGKSKNELYASINKWISINYNSSKSVIQMNDKESGTIIIKGINELAYTNIEKAVYPNNRFHSENTSTKFDHLIEINIRDNKFRISYRITDIVTEKYNLTDKFFTCINFNGENEEDIQSFVDEMDTILRRGMFGKKKRMGQEAKIRLMIPELNDAFVANIEKTMISLDNSTKETLQDNW